MTSAMVELPVSGRAYYQDDFCRIYHCDFRDLSVEQADLLLVDPPYGETRFKWDKWPPGWPSEVLRWTGVQGQMWCFGSMRMFWEKISEFRGWQFVQDIVWEKQNGTSLHTDRFRRVHEMVMHFRKPDSDWRQMFHQVPVSMDAQKRRVVRQQKPAHWGQLSRPGEYAVEEGGPRLMRSVIYAKNCHRAAIHPTQKPEALVDALVAYSCPPGGLVFSPFMGSGTDLVSAKSLGRRGIGCEKDEAMCEKAAKRLSQDFLRL